MPAPPAFRPAPVAALLLAALATGCDAPASRRAPAAAPRPAATVPPLPAAPATPLLLPTARQLGYHRYVGTVDGREVVAETNCWLTNHSYPNPPQYAEWEGSFYDRATGLTGNWLGHANLDGVDQPLETYHRDNPGYPDLPVVVLCADQPPGSPLLTGTYTPPGQRRAVPVRLLESYADAVRYEILTEDSYGPARPRADQPDEQARVQQAYLHLLGPDTLRPALARLQCPTPAARRRARQRLLTGFSPTRYQEAGLSVTLNEGGLLAYTYSQTQGEYLTDFYTQERTRSSLLDLRTGRRLALRAQLKPGGWLQLRRLLSRQARADTLYASTRDYWCRHGQLPLPADGFQVTPTGWQATYGEFSAAEVTHIYEQTLSWAALRPLLRPTSPLRRLLPARGLR